jgi:hypothetical protein
MRFWIGGVEIPNYEEGDKKGKRKALAAIGRGLRNTPGFDAWYAQAEKNRHDFIKQEKKLKKSRRK